MAVEKQEQTSFDEEVINDAGLETLLNERQALKDTASEAQSLYRAKDEEAKGRVAGLELPADGVARCGAFRLSKKVVPADHREFDVKKHTTISIRHVKEE